MSRPQRRYSVTHPSFAHSYRWVAEVRLGLDHVDPENGCDFEFMIRWYRLGDQCVPRIEMFGDAWSALAAWPDVFTWLAGQRDIAPGSLVRALRDMGFVDYYEGREERRPRLAPNAERIDDLERRLAELEKGAQFEPNSADRFDDAPGHPMPRVSKPGKGTNR